jgi:hypothetical protein
MGATSQNFQKFISLFLEFQAARDFVWESGGKFNSTGSIEKIRSLQKVHVQSVTFNPFTAVQQSSQSTGFPG